MQINQESTTNQPVSQPPSTNSSTEYLSHLIEMFPSRSEECLRYVLKLSGDDISYACECVFAGPSLEGLISMVFSSVISDEDEMRLKIDDEKEEDLVDCFFALYKGPRFNPQSMLRVCLTGEPAIDAGGVRRQVFSDVFRTVAFSDTLGLFEGPPDRRRPVFRMSSLAAGIMKLLGRMIGHSIILDCQGFPYLSPACYRYMVGSYDQALPLCQPNDASQSVQHVLDEVS